MIIPTQQEINPGEVHVWRSNLSFWRDYLDLFSSWMAQEEIARYTRYKIAAKQRVFLISRGLLRAVLSSYLGKIPQDIRLETSADGKPFISGSNLEFSLSHTEDDWITSITADAACGADIEAVLPSRNLDGIIKKALHPAEQNYLKSLDSETDPNWEFLSIWTAKEAYLKALGMGIKEYPNWFSVLPALPEKARYILHDPRHSNNEKTWTILPLNPSENCQGSLAVNQNKIKVRMKDLIPPEISAGEVSSAYPSAAGSKPG